MPRLWPVMLLARSWQADISPETISRISPSKRRERFAPGLRQPSSASTPWASRASGQRRRSSTPRQVGKAVKQTARQSRSGEVAPKDLRGRVDLNTYRHARDAKRKSPLFEVFGKQLADSIARMLDGDASAEKLGEIQKAIPDVSLDEDK